MKLLLVTQVVDQSHPNLGFFTEWINEFAKHCEHIEVICLYAGEVSLPSHVSLHSLGKEHGVRSRLVYAWDFVKLSWRLRDNYDAVFVHMNPEYLVLAGLLWRMMGKPSALWYAHTSRNLKLRIAAILANDIFTVSNTSFAIPSRKVHVVGHGIDTKRFAPLLHVPSMALRLITIGRISRSKHLLEMLPVLDELHRRGVVFVFTIIGTALTANDEAYERTIKEKVSTREYRDAIRFAGSVRHERLLEYLGDSDVALNFATTGNMDKSGLEALLTRLPLVTTNGAFRALPELPGLMICTNNPKEIADAIQKARVADVSQLAEVIAREHSLTALIPKILKVLAP